MSKKILTVLVSMAILCAFGIHGVYADSGTDDFPIYIMTGYVWMDYAPTGGGNDWLRPTQNAEDTNYTVLPLVKKASDVGWTELPAREYVMGSDAASADKYIIVLLDTDAVNKDGGGTEPIQANSDYDMRLDIYVNGEKAATQSQMYIKTPTNLNWYVGEDAPVQFAAVDAYAYMEPGDIASVNAQAGGAEGSVNISWNAPWGNITRGVASAYEVRYSENPITNCDDGTIFPQSIVPKPQGQLESLDVNSGILDGTKSYYFSVRAIDPVPDHPRDPLKGGCATTQSAVPPTPDTIPYLANHDPGIDAIASYTTNIEVDVLDVGPSGVDQSTIVMNVNGSNVLPADLGITSVTDGFHLFYDPPGLPPNTQVLVLVTADDIVGNSMVEEYTFYVVEMAAGFTWSSANNPDPADECTPVDFTDTSDVNLPGDGPISIESESWYWEFGDGGDSTDKDPTHPYLDNQANEVAYPVTLTYTVVFETYLNGPETYEISDSVTHDVPVLNVPPVIETVGAVDGRPDECDTVTVSGTFTDCGVEDTHTVTIDWGEGGGPEGVEMIEPGAQTPGSFSGSHQYANEGTYDVTIVVTDDDGPAYHGESEPAVIQIVVDNAPPDLADDLSGLEETITECTTHSFTASFTDCGANDQHTGTINWGDGSIQDAQVTEPDGQTPGSIGGSHRYANEDNYVVTVTVSDGVDTDEGTFDIEVLDSPPVVAEHGNESVDECTILNVEAGFTDCGPDDTHSATIDWGDGAVTDPATLVEPPDGDNPGSVSGGHQYANNGIYTVRVTVTDTDNSATDYSEFQVTVTNVAPEFADEDLDATFTECETASFTAEFTDCNLNDQHTATVDWGDDTGVEAATVVEPGEQTPGTVSGSHQYANNDTYTVTVTLSDDVDDDDVEITFEITITDAAAAFTEDTLDPVTATECDTVSFSTEFTDCNLSDTHTATVNWGDESEEDATVVEPGEQTPGTVSGSHRYADNGNYTVTVTLYDTDEDTSDTVTMAVTITNAAPVFADEQLDPQEATECDTVTFSANFTDCGPDDTHTGTIEWGDQTTADQTADVADPDGETPGTVSGSHRYADNGIYNVVVTVTDNDGGSDTVGFTATITNAAPVIDVEDLENLTISECETAAFGGSFTDCGTADTHTATVDWGDNTGAVAATVEQEEGYGTVGGEHDYANNGVYTVTVTVTDDDGDSDDETFTVTVTDVAPVFDGEELDATSTECEVASFSASFSDCNSNDTHTATVDWGDGTVEAATVVEADGSGTASGSHGYTNNGTYSVTVTVIDAVDTGSSDIATFTIIITDGPPEFVEEDLDTTVTECETVAITASFIDCNLADTHTGTIDWGDGSEIEAAVIVEPGEGPGTLSGSHDYADDGAYTVTLKVTDATDTESSDTRTLTVTVTNVDPVVDEAAGIATSTECEGITISLGFSDCNPNDAHTATIDWGDGSDVEDGTVVESDGVGTVSGSHQYDDNGEYTVTITVNDDDYDDDYPEDGGQGTGEITVSVSNVAPTVEAGPDQEVTKGERVFINPTFEDCGPVDTHTASIAWGDGTTTDGVVNQEADTVTGDHVYLQNGVFTVTVTVTDNDDDYGDDTLQVTVTGAELLSAIYDTNVLFPTLTMTFNNPVDPETICFDAIGMIVYDRCGQVPDKDVWDFRLSDERGMEAVSAFGDLNTVIIDMLRDHVTTVNLAVAALVQHQDVQLMLGPKAILEFDGGANLEGGVPLQFITNGYDLSTVGDVTGDGGVGAYDAALILQATIQGEEVFPIYWTSVELCQWLQQIAPQYECDIVGYKADADGNGDISAWDASLVLQCSAGLIGNLSCTPPTAPVAGMTPKNARLKVNDLDDQQLAVSIDLDDVSGVYSTDIVITYNPEVLKVTDVSGASSISGWLLEHGETGSGKLRISLAGASEPTMNGSLITASFDIESADAIEQLEITEFKLNGGTLKARFENLPRSFALLQNYPNPFNPETWIPYRLSIAADVTITIYNVNGQMVRRLELGDRMPGHYVDKSKAAYWDGTNDVGEQVSSGIYFYQLQTGRDASVKKMIIVR